MKYLLPIILTMACSNIESFPERIDKLRTLGVGANQSGYEPSIEGNASTGKLTFYLASPDDSEIEWLDLDLGQSDQLSLTNITRLETVSRSEFTVQSFSADFEVPFASELEFSNFDGKATIPYGLEFRQGDENEKVQGRLVIYPNEEVPSDPIVSIQILSPAESQSLASGEIELSAELLNKGDEDYRISWFVADGEIPERRSIETKWIGMSSGSKTVIATVRGLKSGNFNFDIVDATVE